MSFGRAFFCEEKSCIRLRSFSSRADKKSHVKMQLTAKFNYRMMKSQISEGNRYQWQITVVRMRNSSFNAQRVASKRASSTQSRVSNRLLAAPNNFRRLQERS